MNKERINTLIVNLEDYQSELEGMKLDSAEELKRDLIKRRVLERLLQLLSEVEIDIVEELYKGYKLNLVDEENSMILSISSLLGKKVTDQLRVRRNLRNQLVLAYNSYTVAEVYEQAKDTSDIDSFKVSVRKLLR